MASNQRPQDAQLLKEEAKIKYKREQAELRKQRIHGNSKTKGLQHLALLNAQLEEKKKGNDHANDIAAMERAQAIEIERILAFANEEEKQMREFQIEQLKHSWNESIQLKKSQQSNEPDIDFNKAGPSSLVSMKGEDPQYYNRMKLQKEQMRQWIHEQIAEKQYLQNVNTDDDQNYADLIKLMDEVRDATEREEADMRAYITKTVKSDNYELAMAQKMRREIQNSINDADNKALATSLSCFDEDISASMDEAGRVKRIDMFRGFTEEQRRTIFQQNQNIIREKAIAKMQKDENDYDWMMQQEMSMRAMEQATYEEECMKNAMKQQHLSILQQQMAVQKKNKQEWEKSKYGAIEPGFFDSFGNDSR